MQSPETGGRTGSRPSAAEGGGASAPALRPADHRSTRHSCFPVSMTSLVIVARAMRKHCHELGTSQGVPEPHSFAVRADVVRRANTFASTASHPTFVTTRNAPRIEAGRRGPYD